MRSATKFSWFNGLPQLDKHSYAKLKILESYLISYFKTLSKQPRMEQISVTIVDGFAGGGLYTDPETKQEVKGSPLICLDSVKMADYEINLERPKKVSLNVDFIFNDIEKTHIETLKKNLILKNYLPNDKIYFSHSKFVDKLDKIIEFIKNKNPRTGRSIFILDQCGYSDVPFKEINKIFTALPKAEVILTFAIDAMLNFLSSKGTTTQSFNNIGLEFDATEFEKINKNWRRTHQSQVYNQLKSACGAKYFTPFFIRNKNGHGIYWLIHLSQHPTARNVMMDVHWQNHNYFIHYGGAGLNMFNMLGYDPDIDTNSTNQFGFEFDDDAKVKSINKLREDLPEIIYKYTNGVTFGDLFTNTCNTTPATAQIYRESLNLTLQNKEIYIVNKNGGYRRSANSISDSDIIIPAKQLILL